MSTGLSPQEAGWWVWGWGGDPKPPFPCPSSMCAPPRRLLEKSQRVEAILASMQATGAEEAQLQEIEEMITAPERQQLENLKRNVNK